MDLTAFFGVIPVVDFALLGLWWVAVQERADLRRPGTRRMSYLVSLQFTIPGTAALLALVDPQVTLVWRIAFGVAGVTGVVALLSMIPELRSVGARTAARFMRFGALPLYVAIAIVAVIPSP